MLTVLARPNTPESEYFNVSSSSSSSCLYLTEDGTNVQYTTLLYLNSNPQDTQYYNKCALQNSIIRVPNTTISINNNVTVSSALCIQNPKLHQWNTSQGDIGLSYPFCSYGNGVFCEQTSFEMILNSTSKTENESQKMTFGLDLYGNSSSSNSSMQIGGVSEKYKGNSYIMYYYVFIHIHYV